MSSLSQGSWFDDEARSTRGIVDEFGEMFTLTPYRVRQVNFAAQPDPSRNGFDFLAAFDRDAKDVSLGLDEVKVSTRQLCLTALVCDVPSIFQGDRITHQLTGEMFEVIDYRPDGLSGIEIRLTQLGRQKK